MNTPSVDLDAVVAPGLSDGATTVLDVITVEDVRCITSTLPRSYEVVVSDRIKFRVGRLVYAAFSRDETVMGVGFPNYAEVPIMPRSWWLGRCSCWSAGLAGVARAA